MYSLAPLQCRCMHVISICLCLSPRLLRYFYISTNSLILAVWGVVSCSGSLRVGFLSFYQQPPHGQKCLFHATTAESPDSSCCSCPRLFMFVCNVFICVCFPPHVYDARQGLLNCECEYFFLCCSRAPQYTCMCSEKQQFVRQRGPFAGGKNAEPSI